MTFEEFYAVEHDRVVRALGLLLSERGVAEDAAAEGFASAWMRWDRVSKMEQPRAWVVTVGLRWARRAWRRADKGAGREAAAAAGSPAVCSIDDQSTAAFEEALAALPPRQRAVVVLRFYLDLTIQETARLTRSSEGNIKRLAHDAVETLRHAGALSVVED